MAGQPIPRARNSYTYESPGIMLYYEEGITGPRAEEVHKAAKQIQKELDNVVYKLKLDYPWFKFAKSDGEF